MSRAADDRPSLDWVTRGQYPIAVGPSNVLTNEFMERGLPIQLLDGQTLQEGAYLTAGNGTLAIIRDPPIRTRSRPTSTGSSQRMARRTGPWK